jgi:hypothetical protein
VNRDKLRRLAALEEEAAKQQPDGAGRSKPGHHDVMRALDQGWEAWRELMRRHGWTDAEMDADLEWTKTVNRRCDEAGFEEWQVMKDMIAFVDAGGEWDAYPGPGFWARGEEGL